MTSPHIEKRFALDTTNPKRVLNSLLERHHSKIVLDKVLVNSNNKFENAMLITDDKEVKDEVVRHFQQQFRRRNHKFNKINEDWKRIYEEQSSIKDEWYKEVMTEITEKEWNETTSTLQKDTAPGISGIGYKLIKNIK